jgi:hypothetical protein
MDRTPPTSNNEAIELYRRTYFSLLRSSGPVRIRSLEETHAAMDSNLHHHADTTNLDVSALVYAAMRMPDSVADATMLVLGQMEDVFEREGYTIADWRTVKARARRRKYFFDDETATMAAFVSSVSDIDDLIPSLTVYQIEWNKLHQMLNNGSLRDRLLQHRETDLAKTQDLLERVRLGLGLDPGDFVKLQQLWPGAALWSNLRKAVQARKDMRVRVLGSGLGDYRRSVQCGGDAGREFMGAPYLFRQLQHPQHHQSHQWGGGRLAAADSRLRAPGKPGGSGQRTGCAARQ